MTCVVLLPELLSTATAVDGENYKAKSQLKLRCLLSHPKYVGGTAGLLTSEMLKHPVLLPRHESD